MIVPPNGSQEIFGAETNYTPPVFDTARSRQEAPVTACADCPSAIWFKTEDWRCFCNIMKIVSRPGKGITACDGRETSVARYAVERSKWESGDS